MPKAQPKPFRRPGIDLDRVNRHWEDNALWRDLQVGDLVVDHGVVEQIHVLSPSQTRLDFPNSSIVNNNDHTVKAFTY